MTVSIASVLTVQKKELDERAIIQRIEDECLSSGFDVTTVRIMVDFIDHMLEQYSEKLAVPPGEIIQAMESIRSYSAPNFYQEANLPDLYGVTIYETLADFRNAIPSNKFRCPSCGGVSNSPYDCDSIKATKEHPDGVICGWKSYGLFRTINKGARILILSEFLTKPVVHEIFMPLDIEESEKRKRDEEEAENEYL
ncbi:hypothetical protein ABLV18_27070 [Klebsiella sp. CN_Kp114]|uniref:hypothetical protein n=1 Tax=unclassified Klebsiella TaxID=2608929 RepID=UPI0032B4FBB6